MIIGIDIGYNATKLFDGKTKTIFASASGTVNKSRFSLTTKEDFIVKIPGDGEWMIGETAVEESRIIARREDRKWITSPEYYRLFIGALSKVKDNIVSIVTGLPVAFYDDKDELEQILKAGEHIFSANGVDRKVTVDKCLVIPQPFGTVACLALDENGNISDKDLASGNVGIIDIGGKTTNILTVSKLSEVARQTVSINTGGWDIARDVKNQLNKIYPAMEEQRDHEIADIVRNKSITLFGNKINIAEIVDSVVFPLSQQVIAEINQMWGSSAGLSKIVITGGGAYFVAPYIMQKYSHAIMVDDPVFSNVIGYYKLGARTNA
ncbi:MAG: ParM/StbA family protein [Spirochaetes bacterium]|nr:ParM/StbA family protein [Spirochaetota bacterium]